MFSIDNNRHALPPPGFTRADPDPRAQAKRDEAKRYIDATRNARETGTTNHDALHVRVLSPAERVVSEHPAHAANLLSADHHYGSEPLLAKRSTLATLFQVPETSLDFLALQQDEGNGHFNIVHVHGVDLSNTPVPPTREKIKYERIAEIANNMFDDVMVYSGHMLQNYLKNRYHFHKHFNKLDINDLADLRIEKQSENRYELVSYGKFAPHGRRDSMGRAFSFQSQYTPNQADWINRDEAQRTVHAIFDNEHTAKQVHENLCDMAHAL